MPRSSSSSSGFSSDEDDDAFAAAAATSSHTAEVHVDVIAEPAGVVDAQCLAAVTPLLNDPLCYDYEAFAAAVALVTRCWPSDATGETEAAYAALRFSLFERFQRAFPLSADMYALWLRDAAASTGDAADATQRVFELALGDYQSVPLALQYAGFLQEHEDESASYASRAAALQQQLLRAEATHFAQGHEVWQFYRERVADDAALSPREKERRTRALFARQMRLPLQLNDLAMSEFRAWNSYNALDAGAASACVDAAVQHQTKALGPLLKKMSQFEARMAQAAAAGESLESVWLQYLNFVTFRVAPLVRAGAAAEDEAEDAGDDLVRAAYERAIAAVCLSPALWTKYVAFVSSSSSSDAVKIDVLERAVRNVSFDSSMWNALLLALEAQDPSIERLRACFEQRIAPRTQPLMLDQYHFLSVLTTYCDAHRRRAAKDQYDARAMRRLRSAFATCRVFLETHFPTFVAGATRLLEYEAKCCLLASQDTPRARVAAWSALWDTILARRGSEAEVWVSLFHESVRTGAKSPEEIRATVFERALQHVSDYPASVLELWLVFERENGSLEDLLRVQQLHSDAAARAANAAAADASEQPPPPAEAASSSTTESKKRKAPQEAKGKAAAAKRAKPAARAEPSAQTPSSNVSSAEKKKSHEALTNAFTLFVSNLSKDVTTEELEALFAGLPGLREVRLVVKARAHHVKSRGMAYVQFSDACGVDAGLAKHGLELKGKAISVERSKPPQAAKHGDASASADLSRDGTWKTNPVTLYVGGLVGADGEHIGEQRLQLGIQQALHAVGELVVVKRVSILRDRRGKPKDYGLVELASAEQTATCVERVAEIRQALGEQIALKPSRFSIDQIVLQQQKSKKEKPDSAAESSAALSTPKQRTPSLGLVPRALRRKPAMSAAPTASSAAPSSSQAPASATEQPAAAAATPKTNADFRKLLMKQ